MCQLLLRKLAQCLAHCLYQLLLCKLKQRAICKEAEDTSSVQIQSQHVYQELMQIVCQLTASMYNSSQP